MRLPGSDMESLRVAGPLYIVSQSSRGEKSWDGLTVTKNESRLIYTMKSSGIFYSANFTIISSFPWL